MLGISQISQNSREGWFSKVHSEQDHFQSESWVSLSRELVTRELELLVLETLTKNTNQS